MGSLYPSSLFTFTFVINNLKDYAMVDYVRKNSVLISYGLHFNGADSAVKSTIGINGKSLDWFPSYL